MRIRHIALVTLLALAGGFAACGGSGIEGTYSDDMGVVSYDFGSDGKVLVTGPFGAAVEMDYERDGDRILVGGGDSSARQVLTITEEGHLDMGVTVLRKRDD